MKCIKCLTKPDVAELTTENWQKCSDCKNAVHPFKICTECGEVLVLCKIVNYYHSDSELKNCGWYDEN